MFISLVSLEALVQFSVEFEWAVTFEYYLYCFLVLVASAQSLRVLKLPGSEISDSMVEQVACRLTTLIYLDLSYCYKIGAPALEAIGKNCEHLTSLNRTIDLYSFDESSQDDEAFAIAASMPKLKYLKIANMRISTEAVLKILSSCTLLEILNISGCYNVELDDKFFDKYPGLKVIRPVLSNQEFVWDWEEPLTSADCAIEDNYYSD